MILEADLGAGVALYDVSGELERTPKEKRRDPKAIVRVYHHHSGAMGAAGLKGLANSVRFVVRSRGFPGPAYTYWLPRAPELDAQGRMAVYRAQPDDVASWHTGAKANAHGIAVCWQGNLGIEPPSDEQYRCAEQLCAYLEARYTLASIAPHSYHAEASRFGGRSKATCPGQHVRRWVESRRERILVG